MTLDNSTPANPADSGGLHRTIRCPQAFWLASGVPALVLFSIGGIAATIGNPSWGIWVLAVGFGFIQAFIYAEIAGLFPSKSGGANVWGEGALMSGIIAAALILPVFAYRHYIQDKGRFPQEMLDDLHISSRDLSIRNAGMKPYLALAAGVVIAIVANQVFQL